jgi:hypothetical protein
LEHILAGGRSPQSGAPSAVLSFVPVRQCCHSCPFGKLGSLHPLAGSRARDRPSASRAAPQGAATHRFAGVACAHRVATWWVALQRAAMRRNALCNAHDRSYRWTSSICT